MIKLILILAVVLVIVMCCKKNKNKVATPKSRFNSTQISSSQEDEPIKQGQVLIFYAPWCGHCKRSMDDFRRASLKNDKIRLINSDENPDIVKQYNIRGYPTIMKTNGQMYTGDRDANSILDFADE